MTSCVGSRTLRTSSPSGSSRGAGAREFRKTIVAFANSVAEGEAAVLFIGVSDRGDIVGVGSPDSLQKTIREFCERDC